MKFGYWEKHLLLFSCKGPFIESSMMNNRVFLNEKIAGIMDLDLYLTDEELQRKDQEHYFQQGIENTKKRWL